MDTGRIKVINVLLLAVVIAGLAGGVAAAGTLPIETERENVEYLLDLWTNRFDRDLREAWDGGYNRFRFRVGSNNVRDWFIEEELKFASPLGGRLRFLYHHARLIRDSSDQQTHDVLEIEGRVRNNLYLSVLVEPAFEKAENSLALMVQHRTAANRFARAHVEFPHLVRNFAERHGDTGGKTLTVFTDQPVRFGLDLRERVAEDLWLRLKCGVTPLFTTSLENGTTGAAISDETGRALEVEGWTEYSRKPRRHATRNYAVGIEFAYEELKKNREWDPPSSSLQTIKAADLPGLAAPWLDGEFYLPTEPDSIYGWEQTGGYAGPFVWVPLGETSVLKCSVRYDTRTLTWRDESQRVTEIENDTFVGGVGIKRHIGRGGTFVEAGFAAEYRSRVEKNSGGGRPAGSREENINDRRVYLAYEYRFSEAKIIRLIETIDLDKEDWGAFSIHDHAFVQLLFDF